MSSPLTHEPFYPNDITRIGFKTLEHRNAKHNSPKKQTPENHKKIYLLRILILLNFRKWGSYVIFNFPADSPALPLQLSVGR